MFAYTVRATFTGADIADAFIAWLRDGHVREVVDAGALSGEIVQLDNAGDAAVTVEVHYRFASREAFDAYERDHAPRLRQEGLDRFPAERGIIFERSTGVIMSTERSG